MRSDPSFRRAVARVRAPHQLGQHLGDVADQHRGHGLLATAAIYQLDALVEVHSLAELERALETSAHIIGINNRNLATFEVDLGMTEKLSEEVPKEIVLVSESGIRNAADLARIKQSGVNAVLIGEALMRAQTGLNGSLLSEPR